MNENDEKFLAKLMVTFREEADEHLKSLSEGLLELESNPEKEKIQEIVERIFREAHSLKGASRSVNQKNIQEICQSLEDVFSLWKMDKLQPNPQIFDILYTAIEIVKKMLFNKIERAEFEPIIEKLKDISNQKEVSVQEVAKPKSSISKATVKTVKKESVRVSLKILNRIFHEIEETLMIKLFSQQLLADQKQILDELRFIEKDIANFMSEVQMERQISANELNFEKHKEFIKKITIYADRQQQSIKASKENLSRAYKNSELNSHFIGSLIDTLLEDMKKVLMQPISILFESIPLMVRDIARNLEKEVTVELIGGEIEVDRRVLEEIKDPIIHIIRNAVDHGIEKPEERVKYNKPTTGTIKIVAEETEGNNVKLSISDDGRGMEFEKIRKAALDKGVISAKDAAELSDQEIIRLAFHSDISTSPIITDLSGRGLGLGIVSEKVDKLGGNVKVETIPSKGTTFILTLPLTLATFRGVHITVGDQDFIIPTHNLKRVFRVNHDEIKMVENRESIVLENQSFAFTHLSDLLDLNKNNSSENGSVFALLVKGGDQTMAFGVDAVHNEQEILVKSLGKQCIRIKNIMAATVLEGGKVVPILNPTDLIRTAIKGELISHIREKNEEKEVTRKSILLVEDSLTTRMLLKNILSSEAYDVKTAVDGAEAFEIMQKEVFDLLITDVEMPRMDGFTLTEKVKKSPKLSEIPIIICTARGSKEDRERGIELGASAYLDKNSFTHESLLNIVKRLI